MGEKMAVSGGSVTRPELYTYAMGDSGFEHEDLRVNPKDTNRVFLLRVSQRLRGLCNASQGTGKVKTRSLAS